MYCLQISTQARAHALHQPNRVAMILNLYKDQMEAHARERKLLFWMQTNHTHVCVVTCTRVCPKCTLLLQSVHICL